MTENCQMIIDFLGCDYELFENEEDEIRLIGRWKELTEQGKTGGFYPLIIVPGDILIEIWKFALEDENLENTAEGRAVLRERILSKAAGIDVRKFLDKRLAEYLEIHKDMDVMGEFKPCEPCECFYGYREGVKPYPEIIIAKIPTSNPWELAAWLPMGGFNDCPSAAEQVAVSRYWHEKYGAVPAVVTFDIWEMELTDPPKTAAGAEALALEQFAFCYDIVMQAGEGWDTIRARASALKDSTTWYFWWD